MDHASFCRGVVCRGVPGINSVIIGSVRKRPLCPIRKLLRQLHWRAHSPLPPRLRVQGGWCAGEGVCGLLSCCLGGGGVGRARTSGPCPGSGVLLLPTTSPETGRLYATASVSEWGMGVGSVEDGCGSGVWGSSAGRSTGRGRCGRNSGCSCDRPLEQEQEQWCREAAGAIRTADVGLAEEHSPSSCPCSTQRTLLPVEEKFRTG